MDRQEALGIYARLILRERETYLEQRALQKAGRKTAVIGLGRSIYEVEVHPYERLGGTLLIGDSVTEGLFDGGCLKAVRTVYSVSVKAFGYAVVSVQ